MQVLLSFRFQNRRAKWRKREKALGRESPTYLAPHDLESFRHQMSTYLSNALTASIASSNERSNQILPPPPPPPPPTAAHYLPFLMANHPDEKLLTRLPMNVLYHNHKAIPQPMNPSSVSPSSNSSSSESYLTNSFDRYDHHHRRLKIELQDTTA